MILKAMKALFPITFLLLAVLGTTRVCGQEIKDALYQLQKAPHILQGLNDPEVTMSVIKLKGLYPIAEQETVVGHFEVTGTLIPAKWPPRFNLDYKLLMKYASVRNPLALYDYMQMEFMVFRAQRNGVTDFAYGIPVFRIDSAATHWSKHLISPTDAEKATVELWALIDGKHTGDVEIRNSDGQILAEGALRDGNADGVWKYRYFNSNAPKGVLQERHIKYSGFTTDPVLHKVNGVLLYQYRALENGFKKMECWGTWCTLTEQTGKRQTIKRFSRKEGQMFLVSFMEGYLDEARRLVRDGEQKTYAADGGDVLTYARYRDGKDLTTTRDLNRYGLRKLKPQVAYCGGGIGIMQCERYDTIVSTEGRVVRMAIQTHQGDPAYPPGEVVPVDTVFQSRTPQFLSSYRLKGNDTSYLFIFDRLKGYGIYHGTDLSSANALSRALLPQGGTHRDGFWPLTVDHAKTLRTDTNYRLTLTNGEVSVAFGRKDNRKHGSFKSFYSTGQLAAKGTYWKDLPTGEWTFYEWDGSLLLSIDFDTATKEEQAEKLLAAGVWQLVHPVPFGRRNW
ncbi:MAG: toxin-antitoxin system YwqK family antitoxin [Saprospiraceae bacterium]